eukprot:TRINITY_DN1406_c0_g1_i2.p1 TRINITY_DN1406_c0_g1~~TRINITY_DN1406_c0_g1_i2.p1  ORF type:complete len:146 (+),score=6.99 TRINITY_DN1406_c0_g1_i2:83-520(+)
MVHNRSLNSNTKGRQTSNNFQQPDTGRSFHLFSPFTKEIKLPVIDCRGNGHQRGVGPLSLHNLKHSATEGLSVERVQINLLSLVQTPSYTPLYTLHLKFRKSTQLPTVGSDKGSFWSGVSGISGTTVPNGGKPHRASLGGLREHF